MLLQLRAEWLSNVASRIIYRDAGKTSGETARPARAPSSPVIGWWTCRHSLVPRFISTWLFFSQVLFLRARFASIKNRFFMQQPSWLHPLPPTNNHFRFYPNVCAGDAGFSKAVYKVEHLQHEWLPGRSGNQEGLKLSFLKIFRWILLEINVWWGNCCFPRNRGKQTKSSALYLEEDIWFKGRLVVWKRTWPPDAS